MAVSSASAVRFARSLKVSVPLVGSFEVVHSSRPPPPISCRPGSLSVPSIASRRCAQFLRHGHGRPSSFWRKHHVEAVASTSATRVDTLSISASVCALGSLDSCQILVGQGAHAFPRRRRSGLRRWARPA